MLVKILMVMSWVFIAIASSIFLGLRRKTNGVLRFVNYEKDENPAMIVELENIDDILKAKKVTFKVDISNDISRGDFK